jgi:hypothetical protein
MESDVAAERAPADGRVRDEDNSSHGSKRGGQAVEGRQWAQLVRRTQYNARPPGGRSRVGVGAQQQTGSKTGDLVRSNLCI